MAIVTLIKTSICPHCPVASNVWKDLKRQFKFDYEEIDANTPKGRELVEKFSITSVPVTLIEDNRGKLSVAFVGVPDKQKAISKIKDNS